MKRSNLLLLVPRHPANIPRSHIRLSIRLASTQSSTSPTSLPSPKSRSALQTLVKTLRVTGYLCLSGTAGILLIGSFIFLHDAFTYTNKHVECVPVSPLALNPERGGPKNLPIARVNVADEEDEEARRLACKPKLVIVGGGWGAVSTLQSLNAGVYHVTVISPETYNTFTPLLPSAAVGTVQVRTLVEPLRKIIARLRGHLIEGKAMDLVMSERLLEVEVNGPEGPDGEKRKIYVPYDKLIIAVGSVSTTHGVPGLEHSFQLKTVSDARAIRRRILDNFETASLPTTTPEERKRLLSFVVCGGGPTGVEAAAEIYDLCQEDIINYYPKICREEAKIHVIQSREHILNTYSEAISKYAEEKFKRDEVDLIVNARVKDMGPTHVTYSTKSPDTNEVTDHVIPTHFVLWSTGIAMNPFVARVSDLLPNQVHKKAIEVDAQLRVKGAPKGEVYAVGDAANLETNLVSHLLELVEDADRDKNGRIDFEEWKLMVSQIKKRIPMAEKHLEKVRELFERYDTDKDDSISLNELALLLQEISSKITTLPALAQVASQQGKYLGKKLNKLAHHYQRLGSQSSSSTLPDKTDATAAASISALSDESISPPFRYLHLGSLAYIGNAAVFDFGATSFMGGLAAMYAWRSVYWSEQVSYRTRALLMFDWIVRNLGTGFVTAVMSYVLLRNDV